VALTAEQVDEYDLPTSPAKSTDSRSARWNGGTCQAEALPPNLLAMIVRQAIQRHLDLGIVGLHEVYEDRERVQLLRALPSGEGAR
jgi:hypothetical protein